MLRIKRTGKFERGLDELCTRGPEIVELVYKNIELFKSNPEDTRLNNHPLTGRMSSKWAFSITNDIRIVYEKLGKKTVRFLAIGGHQKVYKRH